jgi:tetratricopeptide (TPR) repeat protein
MSIEKDFQNIEKNSEVEVIVKNVEKPVYGKVVENNTEQEYIRIVEVSCDTTIKYEQISSVKFFKHYGDGDITICLYQNTGSSGDEIFFVATYSGEQIWFDDDFLSFNNIQKPCFKSELNWSEWSELMEYENQAQTMQDFKDAINMFNDDNFEHPVILYFINLMLRLTRAIAEPELKKDFKFAIDLYNKRLKTDPEDSNILNYKAEALYVIGEYQEAINIYDKILKIGPSFDYPQSYPITYPLSLEQEARNLFDQKKYQEAINLYNKLLIIEPSNNAAINYIKISSDNIKKEESLELKNKLDKGG